MSAVTDCSELSAPAYRGRLATFPSSRRRDGFRERETKEWGKPTVFLLFSPLILSFSFSSPSLFPASFSLSFRLLLFCCSNFTFTLHLVFSVIPPSLLCMFVFLSFYLCLSFPLTLFSLSPLAFQNLCLSLIIHFDSLSFHSKYFSNYLSAIFFLDL